MARLKNVMETPNSPQSFKNPPKKQLSAPDLKNVDFPETPQKLKSAGYQLIREIGEGANGKTYLGKNKRTGEAVAIKALKFSDDLKNYELFEREAETLKQIQTAGVPKFFKYITDGQKFRNCWLVQEYIEGKSLQDLMNQGVHFTESEVLGIMIRTSGIISELQTRYSPPIIHRDIKPSNIMVEFEKATLAIKSVHLIDFGSVANPQRRNGSSTVAGTVGYMAPEQLMGCCTTQSDYYSLGATALYLLTGIQPCDFPTKSSFQLDFEPILKKKCPNVSKGMIQMLGSLLTKAENRPRNASELIQLIEKCIDPKKSHRVIKTSRNKEIKISRFSAFWLKIVITILLLVIPFLFISPASLPFLIMWLAYPVLEMFPFQKGLIGIICIIIGCFLTFFAYKSILKRELINKINLFRKSIMDNLSGGMFQLFGWTIITSAKRDKTKTWLQTKGIIMNISEGMLEYVFKVNHRTYAGYAQLPEFPGLQIHQEIDISYHPRNPKRNAINNGEP